MVRAPCCEKMGLKKGPWTAEEDQVLVDYIERHGHGNWRALPKQAGLLRCGKSCRLRWMNYLRPDIKRGNFTMEEEEQIISLHEKLGNRWSAIAARLPGRTDNEIKNVWHTHLKKRVTGPNTALQETKKKKKKKTTTTRRQPAKAAVKVESAKTLESLQVKAADSSDDSWLMSSSASPAQSCSSSEFSSFATADACSFSGETTVDAGVKDESFSSEELLEIDESFWADALCMDDSATSCMAFTTSETPQQPTAEPWSSFGSSNDDDMEFWRNVFMEAGGMLDLPSPF